MRSRGPAKNMPVAAGPGTDAAGGWWEWDLFGLWTLVNALAYVVIPVVGALLEQFTYSAASGLIRDHRVAAILVVAVVGALVQGTLLGRWQWRLMIRRVPGLRRGRWVLATLVPALGVWLLVLAPAAVDVMARGGDTLTVLRNGFIQALILGPLFGLSQATALRPLTNRWAWWFAANVTTYLSAALLHQLDLSFHQQLSLPAWTAPYFPVLAFAIHGAWMLWVTAPQAIRTSSTASAP